MATACRPGCAAVNPDPVIGLSARQAGLARCGACGTLDRRGDRVVCRLCGARVHSRVPHGLQRVWAFLLVGVLVYVPAMVLPVMLTRSLTMRSDDTIISGVLQLAGQGSYAISIIIFVASICIPAIKFAIIGGLALSLQRGWNMSERSRHRLYRLTELIGRWSMIDVFVVAVLTALIQLGTFITIAPGPGIEAFALSVIFTMLAAGSLDPRLFWDQDTDARSRPR